MLVRLLASAGGHADDGKVHEVLRLQEATRDGTQIVKAGLLLRFTQRHGQRVFLPRVTVAAHLLETSEALVPAEEQPFRRAVHDEGRRRQMQRLGARPGIGHRRDEVTDSLTRCPFTLVQRLVALERRHDDGTSAGGCLWHDCHDAGRSPSRPARNMASTVGGEQTAGMERSHAMSLTGREADRMIEVASACPGGLDARVPTCPNWTVADLLDHLAGIYNRVGTLLAGGLQERPAPTDLPSRPDNVDALHWLSDRLGWLLAAEASASEETPVWNLGPHSPGPASFWFRRMVHETAIHRVDAERAAGAEVTELAPEVAADTISELFFVLRYSEVPELSEAEEAAPGADDEPRLVIHLHATDLDGAEWTCDTSARILTRKHAKGDAALRGPAWALAQWCWGRLPSNAEGIEGFGDLERAEAWRAASVP